MRYISSSALTEFVKICLNFQSMYIDTCLVFPSQVPSAGQWVNGIYAFYDEKSRSPSFLLGRRRCYDVGKKWRC